MLSLRGSLRNLVLLFLLCPLAVGCISASKHKTAVQGTQGIGFQLARFSARLKLV